MFVRFVLYAAVCPPGGEGALLGVPTAQLRVQSADTTSLQEADDDTLSALEDKDPDPVTGKRGQGLNRSIETET